MAKSFLRSGSLDAVLPLGENGQPVYLSALQLRETLRLRKQQQIADCLAIPQPNDAGDRLDWYSPISGKVTSWAAASESARAHALNQLVACQQAVADICQRALQSEKNSQKLFGALLAKALQFPDQNFVYLVGGKPVLTFWGFVSLDKKYRQDALDCLRTVEEDNTPPLSLSKMTATVAPAAPVIVPAPVVAAPAPAVIPAEPKVVESESEPVVQEPVVAPAPPAIASVKTRSNLIRYGWMLPAAALLVAFGVQIEGYISSPAQAPAEVKLQSKPADTQAEAPPVVKPDVKPEARAESPAPIEKPVLPLAPASVAAPQHEVAPTPTPVAEVPAAVEEIPAVPAAKDDLVMPADAVKLGSTKFLNGNWRVIVGGKNPLTGKPPSLRYQMKNGQGIAKITQGDGISCRVDVYAGLMKSGNLVINSRTKAKCSDGSRYQMPELVCKQGATGAAECSGQYDANTVLPMTMKRESK
ncbi:SrfA family protein [Pantoea sp. BAV 3049]|uniref:SrfA family protein n=1 Tax=Pantoea sp. BAV 3049 TaxID=2654188 RepID=UPI00131C4311|nr:SrfA family protein [Pantoea sp. BAV 3049]